MKKGTLHHQLPSWVPSGSRFHIRISTDSAWRFHLTDPEIARALMAAAELYHQTTKWHLHLFVLMPDHLHALASFPQEPGMSRTIASWKGYLRRTSGVCWERNYFDHRLRSDEQFSLKAQYIRMNPVRAGLCGTISEWAWVYPLETGNSDATDTRPAVRQPTDGRHQ